MIRSAPGDRAHAGWTVFLEVHERLIRYYDIDRWHWRADAAPFDVCAGAILVQHTAWTNVEKALANLSAAGIDSFEALGRLTPEEIALLVRPAGTPTIKARRLAAFATLLFDHGGFEGLFQLPTQPLRSLLLTTPGVGPETADVILLYAAHQPVVVHDAYTARLCRRVGIGPESDRYDVWRGWLDTAMPHDIDFRRSDHAAIVIHCKETCRVRPRCEVCPLLDICAFGREHLALGESAANP